MKGRGEAEYLKSNSSSFLRRSNYPVSCSLLFSHKQHIFSIKHSIDSNTCNLQCTFRFPDVPAKRLSKPKTWTLNIRQRNRLMLEFYIQHMRCCRNHFVRFKLQLCLHVFLSVSKFTLDNLLLVFEPNNSPS
jgi:hypothetical protein